MPATPGRSTEFVQLTAQIEGRLENRRLQREFRTKAMSELDRNSEVLSSHGMHQPPKLNRRLFWDLTGLTENDVRGAMQRTKALYVEKVFGQNMNYLPMLLTIRHYAVKKNDRMMRIALTYCMVTIYAIIYRKYFLYGYGRKDVMDYTVNNLSNKFYIKKHTLLKSLELTAWNSHRNSLRKLTGTDDDEILDYIEDLRTRIDHFVQHFYNQFKKNLAAGNSLQVSKLTRKNPDEEEEYKESPESDSQIAAEAAEAYALHFVSNPVDKEAVRETVRTHANISGAGFRRVVERIRATEAKRVEEIALSIFAFYMEFQKSNDLSGVCNRRFIPAAAKTLNRPNAKDRNSVRIREHLSDFLTKHSETYSHTNREKTKVAYRRALLFFFLFTVQKQRCG